MINQVVTVLGLLAFLVTCIVESIKELPVFKKIPTAAVVLVTSFMICPLTMFAMAAYYKVVISWYMVFAAFVAAFIVALVSMSGWERVSELYQRFKK